MHNILKVILGILAGICFAIYLYRLFFTEPKPPSCPHIRVDTVKVSELVHDTLVVIKTIDSVPYPDCWYNRNDSFLCFYSGGSSLRRDPLFADGRTRDTIWENEVIHYDARKR